MNIFSTAWYYRVIWYITICHTNCEWVSCSRLKGRYSFLMFLLWAEMFQRLKQWRLEKRAERISGTLSRKSFSSRSRWMRELWGVVCAARGSRAGGGRRVRFARRLPRAGSATSPPARRRARQCQGRCSRGQLTSGDARGTRRRLGAAVDSRPAAEPHALRARRPHSRYK